MWSLPSFFITVNYEHYHPVCGKTKVFKWLQITQHDIYALLSKSGSAVSLAAIFGSWHLSELVKYESVWSLLQFKVGNLCEGHSNMFVEQLLLYFVFQKSCCLIQCCAQCNIQKFSTPQCLWLLCTTLVDEPSVTLCTWKGNFSSDAASCVQMLMLFAYQLLAWPSSMHNANLWISVRNGEQVHGKWWWVPCWAGQGWLGAQEKLPGRAEAQGCQAPQDKQSEAAGDKDWE